MQFTWEVTSECTGRGAGEYEKEGMELTRVCQKAGGHCGQLRLGESGEQASESSLQGARGRDVEAGLFVLPPPSLWLKAVPGTSGPACTCGRGGRVTGVCVRSSRAAGCRGSTGGAPAASAAAAFTAQLLGV